MKAKPLYRDKEKQVWCPCAPEQATHVKLCVPGPFPTRILPVVLGNATRAGTGSWSWTGGTEKPTLKPSIKTRQDWKKPPVVCHSFVNDGKIKFLTDSTHEFAGQTMDLLDVEGTDE